MPRSQWESVGVSGVSGVSGPAGGWRQSWHMMGRLMRSSLRYTLPMVLAVSPTALFAQWLGYPTSGVPRTPDGQPNLSAPAPRTADGKPDLSGIWTSPDTKYFFNLTADGVEAPMLPSAAALYKQ